MPKSRRIQMLSAFLIATVLLLPPFADAQSRDKGDDKSTKLTFTLHGAHCKECVDRMRASLKNVKGVKFKDEDVKPSKTATSILQPAV